LNQHTHNTRNYKLEALTSKIKIQIYKDENSGPKEPPSFIYHQIKADCVQYKVLLKYISTVLVNIM
jgi:hypothetical protein